MPQEKLITGNAIFRNKFKEKEDLYFDLANNGQQPKVLWVGCSDSRVVPEFIVNAKAGDLFVTRNIANIIPPAEAGESCTSSVLEYAVLHLHVEHIIICGHTGCGGMNAVIDGTPENSQIHAWLKHACHPKLKVNNSNREELVLETIKENVLLQAENLLTFDFVQKRFDQGNLQIHNWLYDMSSGEISYYEKSDHHWHPISKL